jgi:PRD domain protein (TIGR03582 family)
VNEVMASVNNMAPSDTDNAGAITSQVLDDIAAMLRAKNILINAVQKQMLESHIRAMVLRSITGESLPDIDKSLFDEISAESIQMAKQVVNKFATLPIEEAYLLSVHFEVAINNNQ